MTNRVLLTPFFITNATAPEKGRTEYWDEKIPGLALRVTERGAKSWIYMGRVFGKQIRLTLGKVEALSLADARKKALEAYQLMMNGDDPRVVWGRQKEAKRKAVLVKPLTFADCYQDYWDRHALPSLKSARSIDNVIRNHVLPKIGSSPIEEIGRCEIMQICDMLVANGKGTTANRALACTSAMLSWCVDRNLLHANPLLGMRKPFKEKSRERFLTNDEIVSIWNVCEQIGWPFGPYIRFLMLTGQRREETARLKWDHLDLEQRYWNIPSEFTKNGDGQSVFLAEPALAIIETQPKLGEYVFTSTGDAPLSGFSKIKKKCDTLSGVSDWHFHDLRRTISTNFAALGIKQEVTERTLNHKSGKVTGVAAVYNRHDYKNEREAALTKYAEFIMELVNGKRTDRVIPMRKNQARS